MLHKHDSCDLVNMINYMSSPIYGSKPSFVGWIKELDGYWGIKIENFYYGAVHDIGEKTHIISNDLAKELSQIEEGLTYVFMIKGRDNQSYLKRFKDKRLAYQWYHLVESVEGEDDHSLLYYNS